MPEVLRGPGLPSSGCGFRNLRRVISQPFIMQVRGSIASIWGGGRLLAQSITMRPVYRPDNQQTQLLLPPKTKQVGITVCLVPNDIASRKCCHPPRILLPPLLAPPCIRQHPSRPCLSLFARHMALGDTNRGPRLFFTTHD